MTCLGWWWALLWLRGIVCRAAERFPFQSLLDQGIVNDAGDGEANAPKGIAVDDAFHPVSDDPAAERLFCLSIPFILSRHPFIQGITSSHEMAAIVGPALVRTLAADETLLSGQGKRHDAV